MAFANSCSYNHLWGNLTAIGYPVVRQNVFLRFGEYFACHQSQISDKRRTDGTRLHEHVFLILYKQMPNSRDKKNRLYVYSHGICVWGMTGGRGWVIQMCLSLELHASDCNWIDFTLNWCAATENIVLNVHEHSFEQYACSINVHPHMDIYI